MNELVNLTIDGINIEAKNGSTILEVARSNGVFIPTLCHDERVEVYGACGICVVEAENSPKLLRACATKAMPGMVINTKSERVLASRKFVLEMLLTDHTGDCVAPCSLACPAGTDCQGYVGHIANGDYKKAMKILKEKIPLPASIGNICPHPCEKACRRRFVEEPVSIAALKAFVASEDLISEPYVPKTANNSGKNVAVIGGGPGGLSAAFFLREKGHSVKIYDMMPKMGGMLRYGIPQYRLPKEILDKEIYLIERMGIEMINNVKIGKDISLERLRKENDAVIISIGAWKSGKMQIEGESLKNVFDGIDFLCKNAIGNPPETGDRVAVIGGGNTAMDACRTAVRLGAKEVFVIYRRTRAEMPAEDTEIEEAIEEGVIFKHLVSPKKICEGTNGCIITLQHMELGAPDSSGRQSPIPIANGTEELEVNSVIMAIGQKADTSGFESVETTKRGTIFADESTFLTNLEGVFAIGDATNSGADIAISAIGEAQKAATVIDSYLNNFMLGYNKPFCCEKEVSAKDFSDETKMPRINAALFPANERKNNFNAVSIGLTEKEAQKEAARCLECGCLDYKQCKLIEYSRLYNADPSPYEGEANSHGKDLSHEKILRDNDKCILCGLCVRACDQVEKISALGLSGRGFTTVVTPEFFKPLSKTKCDSCGVCVEMCPTGALYERVPGKKNVAIE